MPFRTLIAIAAVIPAPVFAQGTASEAATGVMLPANTEVPVSLNEQLTSTTARKGKVFDVSVSRDVMAGGRVVIPRGTLGHGEVVYRTGRGAFGKSGKVEIKLRDIVLADRIVPLGGRFREEGRGNTGATVGAVLAAGVFAGALVTGHSAVFEQGREFRGYTLEALALGDAARAIPMPALAATPRTPEPVLLAAAETAIAIPAYARRTAMAPRRAIGDPQDAYERELAVQRGVHGRQPQGWTISD